MTLGLLDGCILCAWPHHCCRFSDISGKANEKIFAANYSFLDGYRADEIQDLTKVMRKVKSVPKRTELKSELVRMKQEATERRRGLKVLERFEAMKAEEREKVKAGKKPFFLKASAKKVVGLEERWVALVLVCLALLT